METQKTTIQIDHEIWVEINSQKKVGETFNDVLRRLLFSNLMIGGRN